MKSFHLKDYLEAGVCLLGFYGFVALLAAIVIGQIWPESTIMFVVVCTVNSFDYWKTTLGTLAGLCLYGLSWYTLPTWGGMASSWICALGILIWFISVMKWFKKSYAASFQKGGCNAF